MGGFMLHEVTAHANPETRIFTACHAGLQAVPQAMVVWRVQVWARDPVSGLWWPAEVLDPYNMPKGAPAEIDAKFPR